MAPSDGGRGGTGAGGLKTMHPPAGRQEGARSVRKSVDGNDKFSESAGAFQAKSASPPSRSRGRVLVTLSHDPASLDRIADAELAVGRVAEAERLSHRAAEMRAEVAA